MLCAVWSWCRLDRAHHARNNKRTILACDMRIFSELSQFLYLRYIVVGCVGALMLIALDFRCRRHTGIHLFDERKPKAAVSQIPARTKYCFALISIKMSQFTYEPPCSTRIALCVYHCDNSIQIKSEQKPRCES